MKTIQITVTVDTANEEQMNALSTMLDIISKTGDDVPAEKVEPAAKEKKAAPAATKAKSTITLTELRELTAAKSGDHRAAIKEELKRMKVGNVSSIPEDKFEEYHAFITELGEEL